VDVDDYRRDKTGQVLTRIQELAIGAAILPQQLFTTLIQANGNGYDGAAFFADTHNHGGTIDNLLGHNIVDPDVPTSAEMSQAILDLVQAMYGFTDDRGQPCNEFAQQFALMVPPKYWQAAKAALQNDFTSAGVSNTLKNSGVQIGIIVNPRLLGTAAAAGRRIYLFRTDAPAKPLVWQEESISDAFKTLGLDSSEAFWNEQLAFGAKRIGAAALGRFEYAIRTEFS
jgi:phage major head subunit gpT-like protein